jgi:hypothetical protein
MGKIRRSRWLCVSSNRNSLKSKLAFDYLLVTRFFMSIRRMNTICLGTQVKYDSDIYEVIQANNFKAGTMERILTLRIKDIIDLHTLKDSSVFRGIDVEASEVTLVRSIKNLKHNATSWLNWYLDSWIALDCTALVHGTKLASVEILGKSKAYGKG